MIPRSGESEENADGGAEMDTKALTDFLSELALNNNKAWFDSHRAAYDRLRDEWFALVSRVIEGAARFDPGVAIIAPRDTAFRINRDIRFSPDKRPYKTNFSAVICPQGRKSGMPAYYFSLDEAGRLFVGGGVYMPEPTVLARIRAHIAAHPDRLSAVLADPRFAATYGEIQGERLKRPPQGYGEDSPGIEHIKLKSFTGGLTPEAWPRGGGELAGYLVERFGDLLPLIAWLREALGNGSVPDYLTPRDLDRLAGSAPLNI